jgi:hypothetical protein
MSDVTVPFRQQLDEICNHLENCKIERVRRHSAFTKRFEQIVARHERLTSGRLRRLSLEGVFVDFDSIRGQRREHTFSANGTNDLSALPYLRRSKTEFDKDTGWYGGAPKLYDDNLPEMRERHRNRSVVQKTSSGTRAGHDEDQYAYKHLRLEISFDSKNPNNPHLLKPTQLSYQKGWNNRRNKSSFLNSHSAKRDRNKFQKAYAKVINVQRFTAHRRHTVLSMAPIELGENPPNYRNSSLNNSNNDMRNGSPGFFLGSQISPGTSGKQKFRRAVKKLENANKFSNLLQSARNDRNKWKN